ncbi:recombinase family protein [Leucobacter triazinivorans]|uniref:recombinase family protein n=1 Tax=Leucobacter triazinivorans TaxID=1784719 RepID=UPI001F0D2BF3|nr:recombinase family protein [Leucobacter triazinivorans]
MSTATHETAPVEPTVSAPALTAVSYLRVSTREQAERGGTEEGFSIPAQREANQRKADELGARIVRQFVDAGESARSADRDGLQDMLAFIAATRVTFCIVHKLDRLARNRADDVKIHEALLAAGVTLVSATESIDQTPSGMLVHGIMSSIAEFYSRNLATEVSKGLTQKVAQGGTPGRAPIGYLNVRRTDDQGREIRTVDVDPERAPLIAWAFEQYAGGETSVTGLLCDLTARGLVSVPSPKRPSRPLGKNALYRMLTNPYYAGVIRYKGALHPGAHEPIVEPALFDQVQSLLKARNAHATRHVQHAHHLKGLLHCGTCGSRMLLDFATNTRGTTYAYFVCSGRAAKRTTCTRRAVPVQVAERLVEDSYANIAISEDDYRHLAAEVDAAFDERGAGRNQEFADLTVNRARLEAETDKLLAAHFADAIDLPTLKRHQDRIRAGLADIEQRLRAHDEQHIGGRAFLHDSLRLLTDAHDAYAHSDDGSRRLANQAFYTRLEITEDEQLRPRLAEPFATIVAEAAGGKEAKREHSTSSDVACSRKTLWGDLTGLEPLTSCMRSERFAYRPKEHLTRIEPPTSALGSGLSSSQYDHPLALPPHLVDEWSEAPCMAKLMPYLKGSTAMKIFQDRGIVPTVAIPRNPTL